MERGHFVHLTERPLDPSRGRIMVEQGKAGREKRGSIVNISSDADEVAYRPDQLCCGKSGLLGMTMSAAKEWSKFGVRTNSVCFRRLSRPHDRND